MSYYTRSQSVVEKSNAKPAAKVVDATTGARYVVQPITWEKDGEQFTSYYLGMAQGEANRLTDVEREALLEEFDYTARGKRKNFHGNFYAALPGRTWYWLLPASMDKLAKVEAKVAKILGKPAIVELKAARQVGREEADARGKQVKANKAKAPKVEVKVEAPKAPAAAKTAKAHIVW